MSEGQRESLRDFVVCLSLANLLWIRPWSAALNPSNLFYFEVGAKPFYFLSPAVGVLITALVFQAGLVWAKKTQARLRVAQLIFLFFVALAINALRAEVPALSLTNATIALGSGGVTASALLALLGVAFAINSRDRTVSALRRGLLVLAPFVLVTMGRGIGAAWSEPNATSEAVVASSVAPTSGPRVVVLLFDGMDQETALSTADASRELPAFSRLLNETVHFDQAIAPPNRRTLNSLPSITLGRVVVASEPSGRSDLALTFRDGTHGLWSRLPNMFGISQSEGVKSFVAGWAIPYCRIFGGSISNCTWRPYLLRPDAVGAGLRRDTNFLVASVPGLFRLARLMGLGAGAAPNADEDSLVSWHLDSYRSVHARARIGVRDSSYRLVFVHYPVPHEPIIFDRQSGLLEGNPKDGGYLDNQILADHALEELRGDMEKADTWNRTTVVVMSDHAPKNQPGDRHPILMAKLANSLVPLAVREPASLSGVFGLVLGTLRDQVHTPSEVVDAVMKAND